MKGRAQSGLDFCLRMSYNNVFLLMLPLPLGEGWGEGIVEQRKNSSS